MIELKVDGGILQNRIETRIREAAARGEPLRSDDDPEVLKRRIDAYKEQTAPLVDYYRWQGTLKTVDGMAPIEDVAEAIDRALAEQPAQRNPPPNPPPRQKSAATGHKSSPEKAKGRRPENPGGGCQIAGQIGQEGGNRPKSSASAAKGRPSRQSKPSAARPVPGKVPNPPGAGRRNAARPPQRCQTQIGASRG